MKNQVEKIIERIEEHLYSMEEDWQLWPDDEKGPYPIERIFNANAKFLDILKSSYLKESVKSYPKLDKDSPITALKVNLWKMDVAQDVYNTQLEIFPIGFTIEGYISSRSLIEPDTALVLYTGNLYTPLFHTSLIREVLHVGEKHIDFKTINSIYRLKFLD